MYLHMYMYVYVCILYMYVSVCVSLSVFVSVCLCLCIRIRTRILICTHAWRMASSVPTGPSSLQHGGEGLDAGGIFSMRRMWVPLADGLCDWWPLRLRKTTSLRLNMG